MVCEYSITPTVVNPAAGTKTLGAKSCEKTFVPENSNSSIKTLVPLFMLYLFWKIKYKCIFEEAIIFVDKYVNNLFKSRQLLLYIAFVHLCVTLRVPSRLIIL
jgi:hypothetical protein